MSKNEVTRMAFFGVIGGRWLPGREPIFTENPLDAKPLRLMRNRGGRRQFSNKAQQVSIRRGGVLHSLVGVVDLGAAAPPHRPPQGRQGEPLVEAAPQLPAADWWCGANPSLGSSAGPGIRPPTSGRPGVSPQGRGEQGRGFFSRMA